MVNNTINGRTPEEIKRGLRCDETGDCTNTICPYFPEKDCLHSRHFDVLTLINQLQEDKKQLERERDEARNDLDTINYANTELYSGYEAMKRERDAAVEDLETMGEARAYCDTCLHNNTNHKEEPCISCMSGYLINNWQWRGVQECE